MIYGMLEQMENEKFQLMDAYGLELGNKEDIKLWQI